ncbi:PIG-L family deacetylase [Candidatus Bathyarchaeota archaeon]|nr:PIG-L family deacetylase [Candidatus Bathyarchaeota archaeon]
MIAKSIAKGFEVYYNIFSPCNRNSGLDLLKGTLVKEALEAAATLGVNKERVKIYDFENTRLPSFSNEIRQLLEENQLKIRPDIVLCPMLDDPHQDHQTVAVESLRVFRSQETNNIL